MKIDLENVPHNERLKIEMDVRKARSELPLRLAENALRSSVDYGKWIIASLFVGNSTLIGGAVAFARPQGGINADAVSLFFWGAGLALLTGYCAYINWMIIFRYWRTLAYDQIFGDLEEACPTGLQKLGIRMTFGSASLAGLSSLACTGFGVRALLP